MKSTEEALMEICREIEKQTKAAEKIAELNEKTQKALGMALKLAIEIIEAKFGEFGEDIG